MARYANEMRILFGSRVSGPDEPMVCKGAVFVYQENNAQG